MSTWHHAYNGIPAVREPRAFSDDPQHNFYGDHKMRGHDHLAADLLSGEIEVEIRVKTPTLPAHQTDSEKGGASVLSVPSLSGHPKGAKSWLEATIPVTSFKGMLSSAYEAVTMSRLRVFSEHNRPITSRFITHEALNLYPVLLKYTHGRWVVQVMLGDNERPVVSESYDGWSEPPENVCAAIVPDSLESSVAILDQNKNEIYVGAKNEKKRSGDAQEGTGRLTELRDRLPHRAIIKFEGESEPFFPGHRRVIVSKADDSKGSIIVAKSKHNNARPVGPFSGVVVRMTPPGTERLMEEKCNEFVFFNRNGAKPIIIVLGEESESVPNVIDRLVEVIHSYIQNVKSLSLRERRSGDTEQELENAIGRTSVSPNTRVVHDVIEHYRSVQERSSKDGVPLHSVEISRDDILEYLEKCAAANITRIGIPLFASIKRDKVVGLYPSQMGRRASQVSPWELAHDSRVDPPSGSATMSPADRLWGYVAPDRSSNKESRSEHVSAQGRIVIDPILPIVPTGEDNDGSSWLKVLENPKSFPTVSSPKPSTGVTYLRDANGRSLPESLTRAETYRKSQTLIRKVYPTHRAILDSDHLSTILEHSESGASQPRVASYLRPGAKFNTRIRYSNLSSQELAVLLWLLSPKQIVPSKEKRRDGRSRGVHHIGFGKPYGMGAIEVEATAISCAVGSHIAADYRELRTCLGANDHDLVLETLMGGSGGQLRQDLLRALPDGFLSSLAVRSFVRSAYGWNDYGTNQGPLSDNVRYPNAHRRIAKGEISPIVEWFKRREEERVKARLSKKNQITSDYHLPPLVGE